MLLKPTFSLKAPIQGVAFSNQEVGLGVEIEVEDNDWASVEKQVSKQMKQVVEKYFNQLQEELTSGQSEVIQKIQLELSKEYEDKLDKASKEIYKLRDLLKENDIPY